MRLGRVTIVGLALFASCAPNAEQPRPERAGPTVVAGPLRFVDEAGTRGVDFVHQPTRTAEKLMPEILGSGVAVADFDRDGAPDLYFVGGGSLRADGRPAVCRDRLFLNDGSGGFRDASETWGVTGTGYGMGLAVGDYDGDGWTDLVTTSFAGGERLYRNTGTSFIDVTEESGLGGSPRWGTSAGFSDFDGDGDLDLYVVRYVEYGLDPALPCTLNGRHTYCSPALFEAEPDTFWRNEGGRFVDASGPSGIAAHACKGLALALGDVDGDGDVDAFVANDITRNLLWINDGAGRFTDRGILSGTAYDETGRASAGMGADFSDIDENGLLDIACTNFQDETSNLFVQGSPEVFRDRAYALGVGQSAQQRLSFGVDFFDADNDGDEDLFVANGHIDDGVDAVSETTAFAQPNSLYLLEGGRFEEVGASAGSGLALVEVSRAAVSADLDGDGRLDLVLTSNAGPARLLMNRSEARGEAVVLWLERAAPHRSPIGTRVEARVGERVLLREVHGSSSFLSHCDARVHLGLGEAQALDELVIRWPGAEPQEIAELAPGFWRVVEGREPETFTPGAKVLAPE